jgi:hypothetical protein
MIRLLVWVLGVLSVLGCAHKGAVRVRCEGPLRPVNAPVGAPAAPAGGAPDKTVEDGRSGARP